MFKLQDLTMGGVELVRDGKILDSCRETCDAEFVASLEALQEDSPEPSVEGRAKRARRFLKRVIHGFRCFSFSA